PAFAALTRWWGPRRVTALTALTLLAGLASTIFAPLTAALFERLGWRGTYLVLAAVLAAVTLPAHLLGPRGPWPAPDHRGHGGHEPGAGARSRPFVRLVAAIALGTFAAFAVVVNQVPLLIERGLSTTLAAWALGLGGLGQVLGRLGYGRLAAHTSVRARGVLVLALTAAATALLGLLPGPAVLLIAAAMLAGAARGVFTLLQATAVSDRWGAAHYGRLNGILSAPAMIATALAPWAGAALAGLLGGYPPVFAVLAVLAALAAVLALGTVPPRRPATGPTTRPTVPDHPERGPVPDVPEVLFVCVHNAGRSQMAAALLDHHARGRVRVRSAGSAPADRINPAAHEVMAEIGLDLTKQFPKPLTDDAVRAADVVVTMGCGDACPVYPGKRYLDWELPDPADRTTDDIRSIRDEIDARVRALLAELTGTL